jgi:hypothetical protein
MSFLAAKKASPQSAMIWPSYTGLQLQTSANAMPIPLMWGMTKLAVNIIFYENFQAHPVFTPQQQTGKGGGKGAGGVGWQLSGWTYSADLMMALCEGPVSGIGQVWQGQAIYGSASSVSGGAYGGASGSGGFTVTSGSSGLAALGLTLFEGASPQATWGYLAANYSDKALTYPGTAYVCAANFNLGSSASIGSLNFEVQGPLFGTGANGLDADPAQVIADFLLNPQYGVGFPGAAVDATSLFGPGGDSSVQSYCRAMGLCFSPLVNQMESASSVLSRWLQLLSVAAVWSGDRLRFIPYCDEAVAGNGVEYVPDLSPVYALNEDDLVYMRGEDPIKASRLDPFTLPNFQWLEALNRTGLTPSTTGILEPQGEPEYQATPVAARDQSMIEQFGLRVGSTITAHEFCDLNAAAVAAQTILQRTCYVRASYKFALSWEFCLLDPTDIVALTDANLGLSGELARIVDIEEDDSGMLTITAEELTIGVSMPAVNPIGPSGGGSINRGVSAAPVNAPLIFEPPPPLTGNNAEIWLGASGSGADPNWGGCTVWASLDDLSYQKIASISNPMRQGSLTAALPSASGYDTGDILAVDLSESGGTLATATQATAEAGQTLCLVDEELIAFANATPTAANRYALSGLPRGMYGSAPATHAVGAPFARLDGALARYSLPADFIGRKMYLKFQSFNVFGAGTQDISTCSAYGYQPNGNGRISQTVLNIEQGVAQDWGFASAAATQGDDWGTIGSPYYVAADLGGLTA